MGASQLREIRDTGESVPLWALLQDADLTIAFHVSTGRDPRAAGQPQRVPGGEVHVDLEAGRGVVRLEVGRRVVGGRSVGNIRKVRDRNFI